MNKELIYQAIQAIDHLCKNTTAHPDYDPQIVGKACAALEQALLIDVSPAQMAHADAVAEPEQIGNARCPRCWEPITAPTPRQWVSLTEQEMYDLFFNDQYGPRLPEYLVNTIKCVEAALKEKNT